MIKTRKITHIIYSNDDHSVSFYFDFTKTCSHEPPLKETHIFPNDHEVYAQGGRCYEAVADFIGILHND